MKTRTNLKAGVSKDQSRKAARVMVLRTGLAQVRE